MLRRIFSGLCFALLASALAFGEASPYRRDIHNDRRDLRHHRTDRRQDRRDIHNDRRDLRHDVRDLRRDRRDIHHDRRDIRSDYHGF